MTRHFLTLSRTTCPQYSSWYVLLCVTRPILCIPYLPKTLHGLPQRSDSKYQRQRKTWKFRSNISRYGTSWHDTTDTSKLCNTAGFPNLQTHRRVITYTSRWDERLHKLTKKSGLDVTRIPLVMQEKDRAKQTVQMSSNFPVLMSMSPIITVGSVPRMPCLPTLQRGG